MFDLRYVPKTKNQHNKGRLCSLLPAVSVWIPSPETWVDAVGDYFPPRIALITVFCARWDPEKLLCGSVCVPVFPARVARYASVYSKNTLNCYEWVELEEANSCLVNPKANCVKRSVPAVSPENEFVTAAEFAF